MKRTIWVIATILVGVGLAWGVARVAKPLAPSAAEVIRHYADAAYEQYALTVERAQNLKLAVEHLIKEPSEAHLSEARLSWIRAREAYVPTEVYRFYDGPIEEVEGFINAWPLDEAYVDYVISVGSGGERKLESGIVSDVKKFPQINKQILLEANEKDGETQISTGFHAIEFLLWGQDRDDKGPGNRPVSDFADGSTSAERRKQMLSALTELLVEHLAAVRNSWKPDTPENYRARFLSLPEAEALTRIFSGIVNLSGFELAGERMFVALESQSQEDEQSCFSDTTHQDLEWNAFGVEQVFTGEYPLIQKSGPGLRDLLLAKDAPLTERLQHRIQESKRLLKEIPAPFDQVITASEEAVERQMLLDAVQSFEDESEMLLTAARTLGLEVSRAQ